MIIIGQKAPDFEATNQNGELISLNHFIGKKIILFFYPKDNTPGCTAESCDFRDHYQTLISRGFEVIGISIDNEKSHKKFADKFNLPYNILVDENKYIVELYGVWGEKSMYGKTYMGTIRKTFVIDENGKIEHIIDKVDTKNPSAQILNLY